MKKLISKGIEWSHTPVGDAVVTGIILILGLIVAHWLSWMLWATGYWG